MFTHLLIAMYVINIHSKYIAEFIIYYIIYLINVFQSLINTLHIFSFMYLELAAPKDYLCLSKAAS